MELFDETEQEKPASGVYTGGTDENNAIEAIPGLAAIFELSVQAYYAAVHAQMSELPINAEICRFVEKVLKAGAGAANGGSVSGERAAAHRVAFDRGDPDAAVVLKAAWKVRVEIHRLTGLLRFSAESNGTYIARCCPDHFILPALAEHFTLRFGEIPWAIIDERRGICLCREKGGEARIVPLSAAGILCAVPSAGGSEPCPSAAVAETEHEDSLSGTFPFTPQVSAVKPAGENRGGYWEDLWRLYHRSINNESRYNPRLQRQFMPERYHKYLTEMN